MIDIHSHLLYSVDDGSQTIEESLNIIRELNNIGITDIILTPHYIKESKYNNSKKENMKILNTLKKSLLENKIKTNLYLGNEIYINNEIEELLKKNIISSLNDTNYLLIELPLTGEYEGYLEIFENLINEGYHIILAHPERYYSFQNDFNKIYELEQIGVYFQSNIESIVGSYGRNAIKMVKRLLKEKKISFLATDIHHQKKDYNKWQKARKKILKYVTKEEYNILTYKNPRKLIK